MSARDDILAKVKAAIADAEQEKPIPREYRTTTTDGLDTFLDRLAHYDATTHVVEPAELEGVVRAALGNRRRIIVPEAWMTAVEEPLTDDPPLTHDQIDQSQGVLTTCALAIAQTGTIILDGGPGMGRRALTLLPDYHLCVVKHDQIVASVPEAIAKLQTNPTRPITFISGPSATVDIEMTRVRGVHGPRNLEVIITT
ncbi:MAG TPA: LUD domain-containing protein [Solirubrobacteraceae bacterium]|nr:LUD domain-containing protein [Solirubrobacteraceae bacterium]